MPSLVISTPAIILLSVVVTAAIIWLIALAVRMVSRPRNRLLTPAGDTLNDELTEQVRELKATGQTMKAVFLVRGETGLSHRASARLVRKL